MKIAYLCEPHVGGTFRFFLCLRPELARLGIQFRCLPSISAAQLKRNPWADREGVDALPLPDSPAKATGWLNAYLEREQFSAVMILPGCDAFSSSLPMYLSRSVRCLARVPVMTRGAYRPLNELARHINRVVAVCPRIADDLVLENGWPRDKISVVSNGISKPVRERKGMPTGPLRVLYAGRVENLQKNVFLLPEIMRRVWRQRPEITLTIVGDGPDLPELKNRFLPLERGASVRFTGIVPPEEMESYYLQADVLLLPTRYEGSSNTLLEAMSAGCSPVVSLLRGVTDVVVEQGTSGWCVPVGDAEGFADIIIRLGEDVNMRQATSQAAKMRVINHFSLSVTAEGYRSAFQSALETPDDRLSLRPVESYRSLTSLRPSWRRYIPASLKNRVRNWLERRGQSL